MKVYLVTLTIYFVLNLGFAQESGADEDNKEKALHLLLPNIQQYNPVCIGAKNDRGKCVSLETCVLDELKEDYIKYRKYFCITRKGKVGVCCPDELENRFKRQTTAAPSIININEGNVDVEGSLDYTKLGEYQECGYSSKNIKTVMQGRAILRDWPWMVAILRKDDMFHYCGGVLITKRHVLTAAHCVTKVKPELIVARVGEYDFKRLDESKAVDMVVKEIWNHEEYDYATYENDIAILLLGHKVEYNINVKPICLPLPGPDYINTTAVVAGWGTLDYGGPMSDVLMEVPIPVWEQNKCVDSFTQAVFDTNMCAGGYEGGKDSCQGDSGGPLMSQRDDGRWMTIGVVSWGIRCGEKGKPGIYTRVNNYLDWIAEKIN